MPTGKREGIQESSPNNDEATNVVADLTNDVGEDLKGWKHISMNITVIR